MIRPIRPYVDTRYNIIRMEHIIRFIYLSIHDILQELFQY